MQFTSKSVRDSLGKTCTPNLASLKRTSKQRYQQTLQFMQQWTVDLMQRENELQKQRQELYSSVANSTKKKDINNSPIDIQQLIKGQFLKRMQSLFMKQMALNDAQSSLPEVDPIEQDSLDPNNNTFSEEHLSSLEEGDTFND